MLQSTLWYALHTARRLSLNGAAAVTDVALTRVACSGCVLDAAGSTSEYENVALFPSNSTQMKTNESRFHIWQAYD